MIDLRAVRENPDLVRASQRARGEDESLVDALVAADERRRLVGVAFETLRGEQKALGKQVAAAKGEEKTALLDAGQGARGRRHARPRPSGTRPPRRRRSCCSSSRNLVAPGRPGRRRGRLPSSSTHVGTPRDFAAEGFTPRDHVELGTALGAIDLERGAKVSGSRFYFLTGVGALLELALVNLAISQAVEAGFTPVIAAGAGQAGGDGGHRLPRPRRRESTGWRTTTSTSSARPRSRSRRTTWTRSSTPPRCRAATPASRPASGARPARYGKDTRGHHPGALVRQGRDVLVLPPEDAEAEHPRLLGWEKEFLDKLELPFQVLDVATGDLGSSAPRASSTARRGSRRRARYRELTSTSNCTEFQSRRLAIRWRTDDGVAPVATAQRHAVRDDADDRRLLENHQQADGSVQVPPALRPYLGGRELLQPL